MIAARKVGKSAAPSGSVTATQQVASFTVLLDVKGRKNNFAQKGKLSFLRLSRSFSSKLFLDTGGNVTRVLFLFHCRFINLYFSMFSPYVKWDITPQQHPHLPNELNQTRAGTKELKSLRSLRIKKARAMARAGTEELKSLRSSRIICIHLCIFWYQLLNLVLHCTAVVS